MECTTFRNKLFAYTEKSLPSGLQEDFALHSSTCKECSHILSEFRYTTQLIDQAKQAVPDALAAARILQKLEEHLSTPQPALWPETISAFRVLYLSLGAAAAILLGVTLGYIGEKKIRTGKNSSDPMNDIRTELNVPKIAEDDIIEFSN